MDLIYSKPALPACPMVQTQKRLQNAQMFIALCLAHPSVHPFSSARFQCLHTEAANPLKRRPKSQRNPAPWRASSRDPRWALGAGDHSGASAAKGTGGLHYFPWAFYLFGNHYIKSIWIFSNIWEVSIWERHTSLHFPVFLQYVFFTSCRPKAEGWFCLRGTIEPRANLKAARKRAVRVARAVRVE